MIDTDLYPPEDAIRLRSYLIWQQEGCPHGADLAHWLRAKEELERERYSSVQHAVLLRKPLAFVMPRIPISVPPCKSVSFKIGAAVSAARR